MLSGTHVTQLFAASEINKWFVLMKEYLDLNICLALFISRYRT